MSRQAVIPGFQSISEFWAHNDTCGPAAYLMALYPQFGKPQPFSGPTIDGIRALMVSEGLWSGVGCTMGQIRDHAVRQGHTVLAYQGYSRDHEEACHQMMLQYAGEVPVLIQLEYAYKLPFNEQGVYRHFVALGGIDPVRGYLVGNGDDVLALNINGGHGKTYPARWMYWSQIQPALVTAVLALKATW